MSSDPKLPDRLPFEPTQKKKSVKPDSATVEKGNKKPKREKPPSVSTPSKIEKEAQPSDREAAKKSQRSSRDSGTIPEVVSKRMARRMALFCGIPSTLGMLTFIASYLLLVKAGIKLPNVAVVLVSMGFLGLGVLGLSYGLISASWDEERVGTRVGLEEFNLNLKRLTDAWKSARQKKELSE
ncbi:MAG: PAM68 family protein [Phormidesmis sp. CAN_BIN36]|nr:PAM68 family protein [Phormidesmis sp. CAN_BIN36]